MGLDYYVYKHYREDDNQLFYIGLGRNKRAYQVGGRNKLWTNIYKKHGRRVEICSSNLSLAEANLIERKLIEKYGKLVDGSGILSNIGDGGGLIWNRGLAKEKQPRYNHKNTKEHKNIISKYMKENNPMKDQVVINKMIDSKKGSTWDKEHKRLKTIEVTKNGQLIGYYNGPKDLCSKLDLKYGSVTNVLIGKRNSLYGYKIKYLKDVC